MPKSSRSRGWSTTILIADDEPTILYATAMFLKDCGYNVLTAEDGEEALKAFAEAPNTIQLVISDVVMPEMRGPQLVRSIKTLSPSTATLLMSGTWTTVPDEGVALIGKPFTRQKLLATVRGLLDACDFAEIEREQSVARSRRLAAISGAGATQPKDSVATE
jgi:DNA-binding NtrC family response regulator